MVKTDWQEELLGRIAMGKTDRDQIVYVRGYDWEGVYVNGILKVEGHNTHNELRDIILDMAGDVVDFKMMDADLDWLEEAGNLPKSVDDVVEDADGA